MTQRPELTNRQLEMARRSLERFDGKLASLGALVQQLDALWSAMAELEDDERRAFRRVWGVLEEVYAVALDRRRAEFDPAEQHLVDEAVAELKRLVSASAGA